MPFCAMDHAALASRCHTLVSMSDSALVPDHLLLAIDHVGIAVPDLDDALEFYASTFGLHSVHEEINEEQGRP